MEKKRKILLWGICAAVIIGAVLILLLSRGEKGVTAPANAENFGELLTHLVQAYETPSAEDRQTIETDLAAIRAVSKRDHALAASIAGHWEQVFLDGDYPLFLYDGEAPSRVPKEIAIPNNSGHAIVVLGYELEDGEMQEELLGRCEAAAALAKAFPETILVCSGGATGHNNPEGHTEAGLMKDYLSGRCGIAPERIFIDEEAMTTAENAIHTFEILRAKNVHTMTIVTSTYHMRWGQAVYHTLAELYRRQYNYGIESIANFCYDTEPTVEMYRAGDRIAAFQIAGILELPEDVIRSLPSFARPAASPPAED